MNPNIRYVINENKKTVTAIADDCMHDAVCKIEKAIESSGSDFYTFSFIGTKYYMPDIITATIKCDETEDFADIERHKLNARNSLMDKYHKMRLNRIEAFFQNNINFLYDACINAIKKDRKVLEKYPFKYVDKAEFAEIEKRRTAFNSDKENKA